MKGLLSRGPGAPLWPSAAGSAEPEQPRAGGGRPTLLGVGGDQVEAGRDRAAANGEAIPIEQRSPDEVLTVEGVDERGRETRVRIAPAGTRAENPAFDITPAHLIAGLVTEVGIAPASPEGIAAAFGRT